MHFELKSSYNKKIVKYICQEDIYVAQILHLLSYIKLITLLHARYQHKVLLN